MRGEPKREAPLVVPRALHLHPSGPASWIGIAYLGGVKQPEIGPMRSIEDIERVAEERHGRGLQSVLWAQDDGMILSEG